MYGRYQLRLTALSLIAAASLITGSVPARAFAATGQEQSQIDSAGEKKNALEQERKKTQDILDNLNGMKADTTAYVKQLDENLDRINAEMDKLNEQIAEKKKAIDETGSQLKDAEQVSGEQLSSMKTRIKYMYEQGSTGYLELLFSSSNLTELLNRVEYIRKITEYDRDELNRYESTCKDISDKQKQLTDDKAALEALKDDEGAKQESAETLLANKKSELSGYESKIGSAQSSLSDYDQQIKAQEDEIKAIEAEVRRKEEEARKAAAAAEASRAAEASKAAAEGKKAPDTKKTQAVKNLGDIHFTWPCPAGSSITSGFGSRKSPVEGASSNHMGIDISAASGSSVVAAADGEVVVSTYSPSAGNYIMLSHGGGTFTLYMHCSALNVSEGQSVKAGQTIGKVGSTGYSTGPHLHFAIRSGGQYLNPLSYVGR